MMRNSARKRRSTHKRGLLSIFGLVLLLWVCSPAAAQDPSGGTVYDLVIRGGRVLDGTGSPWIKADVAVKDGRFAKIGHIKARGRREIDASGKYVAPGFIDMMDHSGSVLLENGRAVNKLRMGVTTTIGGEGGTPAITPENEPANRRARARELDEYFAAMEEKGSSINFGTYYSETQARAAVVGMEDRAPTENELSRMKQMMRTAMKNGAMGMSTALIYPPSSYTDTDELVAMARVASQYGGIYASHIRDEGKGLVGAIGEAIEIGKRADLPVEVFHLKAAYQPGWGTLIRKAIQKIDSARAQGIEVTADMYPYTAAGTGLEATIPSWAFAGGEDSLLARLNDPETRARLKREVETGSPGWWNIVKSSGGWDNIVLANARNEKNEHFENMSVAEIAEEQGKDPADAAWDLVAQGDGRVMAIYHMMSEDDVETAMQQPWVSIGSDAGAAASRGAEDALGLPHPRSYGTFPRVVAHFTRDRGVLTLPQAIHKMTGWPSARMRLSKRGLIREGFWADAVVFDLDEIEDRATYEKPKLYPKGIPYVLVNGRVVIKEGKHTGRKPGRMLYGPGYTEKDTPLEKAAAAN